MSNSDDYFQLSNTDKQNIQSIKSKWRFQSYSFHGQPQLRIECPQKPQRSFQLPDVFMTTRQNQQRVSIQDIPKNIKKESQISLGNVEGSPKHLKLKMSKKEKSQHLSDLEKNYSLYKKQFHRVKTQQQPQQYSQLIDQQPESSFLFNGVKLPYSLYMINKNRQLAITNMIQTSNAQVQESPKQQIEMIENQIKKVRSEHQNKQKMKEYRSRSYLTNAYYSILCVNQNSKKRLKKIIQGKFPKESRFQQL